VSYSSIYLLGAILMSCASSLSHNLPAAARRRSESSGATNIHSGAQEHAGEDHKVRESEGWRGIG
jgi:hypothetical protein